MRGYPQFPFMISIALAKARDTPGDFIRRSRRIWSPAKIASDFRHWLMRTHLAIFFADRGDVAVLKTHVIKSPNLTGWLYWRSAAINVENRVNGYTWRMPANLIADIWHARYRRFYTPIAAISENRNRCTGHTWRFSRSRRSAYKIAKCVAGLRSAFPAVINCAKIVLY